MFMATQVGRASVVQETVKLVPSDFVAPGNGFGASVSISGDYIAIGAPLDQDVTQGSGAAYIFVRDDNGTPDDPGDDTWVEETKLIASDAGFDKFFGQSVSIDGGLLVVGAPAAGPTPSGPGGVYVFRREEAGWVEEQKLVSSGSVIGAAFGLSVSISGELVVVGAPGELALTGRAYVFRREGMGWVEEAVLSGPDPESEDMFGVSVAISGGPAGGRRPR
jgi:hypothetical protein